MKKLLRNAGIVLSAGGIGIYTIYQMVFGRMKKGTDPEQEIPKGIQYDPFAQILKEKIKNGKLLHFQRIFIESKDGITLAGKYYHRKANAPIILFFHGYHSGALRDGSGILEYAKKNGYNVLLADQRGHGKSGGKTITFGIRERYDVLDWIWYLNGRFGEETKIVLAGISMGASTVLMSADLGLPANVKGIMADCPYSSPKEILQEVIRQMNFPKVTYATVRLAAKIFGGFDVEENSSVESMRNCNLPILLIHGDEDYFVPCEMSRRCYDACEADKRLVLVEGAPHGMSYCTDQGLYEKEMTDFLERILS